jgi:hypothetical protein
MRTHDVEYLGKLIFATRFRAKMVIIKHIHRNILPSSGLKSMVNKSNFDEGSNFFQNENNIYCSMKSYA